MPEVHDYLLSYGTVGDFGRFHSAASVTLRRGKRAVVRSHRGMEIGTVLCPTNPGHALHLPNTSVGQLLRLANSDDERAAADMEARAHYVFSHGRELVAELGLPLELLDVEVLLDGQHAVLYHLRWAECDVRPFVSALSKRHDLHIEMQDLSRVEESEGCGKPNCGQGGGGCGSCSSGGGCGSCGTSKESDAQAYFAGLR